MTITLREITSDNWRAAINLKLHDGQEKFVAPNWYSMLEAIYSNGELHSRVIYHDDTMIGYVMYGHEPQTGEAWIVRLMTDKDAQGKGYGRTAMGLIIDQVKQTYNCKEIFISVVPENITARKLYESLGFQDTGRVEDDELVFRLTLEG